MDRVKPGQAGQCNWFSPAYTHSGATAHSAAICAIGHAAISLDVGAEAVCRGEREGVGALKRAPVHGHREALGRQQPRRARHCKRHGNTIERLGGPAVDVIDAGVDTGDIVQRCEPKARRRVGREIATRVGRDDLQWSALRRLARARRDARRHIGAARGAERHLVGRGGDGAGADCGRAGKRRDRAGTERSRVGALRYGAWTAERSRVGADRAAARADRGCVFADRVGPRARRIRAGAVRETVLTCRGRGKAVRGRIEAGGGRENARRVREGTARHRGIAGRCGAGVDDNGAAHGADAHELRLRLRSADAGRDHATERGRC